MVRSTAPLIVVAFLSLAVAAPRAARAQKASPEVQALIDEAQTAFKEARYSDALAGYEAALADGGPAPLRFMVGRCHQMLAHWEEARAVYRTFLADEALPAGVRARAEAELAAVEEALATGTLDLRVEPAGAVVFVDGRRVGVAPVSPLVLPAGRHVVRVEAPGHESVTRDVVVPGGGATPLTVALAAAGPPTVVSEPVPPEVTPQQDPIRTDPVPGDEQPLEAARPSYSPWTWVTLGAGLAVVAGGTTSYVLGEQDHKQILDAGGYGGGGTVDMTQQRALDLESSGDTKKLVGYVLWGVGGALVVTSSVLFILDATSEPAERSIQVGAAPAPGGGVLSVQGRF